MKPRGMRIIQGDDAMHRRITLSLLTNIALDEGYREIVLPNVWGLDTFKEKYEHMLTQMYIFKDKNDRELCLVPEATAMVRELFIEQGKRPMKVFYTQRCYRYERPQRGRYREFTQFGVECLGKKENTAMLLKIMLEALGVDYTFNDKVQWGLDYYIEDGFEAECESLGAQKQIAGGGKYDCGEGFAIGIDRVLLANEGNSPMNTARKPRRD